MLEQLEFRVLKTEHHEDSSCGCYVTLDEELFEVITPIHPAEPPILLPTQGLLRLVIKNMGETSETLGSVSLRLDEIQSNGEVWLPLLEDVNDDSWTGKEGKDLLVEFNRCETHPHKTSESLQKHVSFLTHTNSQLQSSRDNVLQEYTNALQRFEEKYAEMSSTVARLSSDLGIAQKRNEELYLNLRAKDNQILILEEKIRTYNRDQEIEILNKENSELKKLLLEKDDEEEELRICSVHQNTIQVLSQEIQELSQENNDLRSKIKERNAIRDHKIEDMVKKLLEKQKLPYNTFVKTSGELYIYQREVVRIRLIEDRLYVEKQSVLYPILSFIDSDRNLTSENSISPLKIRRVNSPNVLTKPVRRNTRKALPFK